MVQALKLDQIKVLDFKTLPFSCSVRLQGAEIELLFELNEEEKRILSYNRYEVVQVKTLHVKTDSQELHAKCRDTPIPTSYSCRTLFVQGRSGTGKVMGTEVEECKPMCKTLFVSICCALN
jgi:hypothetical protein